jgi:antibiotic biosynthesis monooxygenase (ABM) superfamily enzyme
MPTPPKPPSVHRRAVTTWLGVYPLITLVLWVLGPHMVGWPLAVRTLLLTAIAVPAAVYLVVPTLNKVVGAALARK